MENRTGYFGVNFNNLRKALYLLYFGVDEVKDKAGKVIKALSQDFSSPKYRYIVPMQGNFDNPLQKEKEAEMDFAKDTFIQYWISDDRSLTQDDYVQEGETGYSRQKCVASVLVRFIGKEAETWVKAFRHLAKRNNVTQIWSGVCNAEKLVYTSPIVPRRINYFGKNSQVAFDVRFKLYYDEVIATNWQPLEGVNFKVEEHIYIDAKASETDQ